MQFFLLLLLLSSLLLSTEQSLDGQSSRRPLLLSVATLACRDSACPWLLPIFDPSRSLACESSDTLVQDYGHMHNCTN